MIKEDFGKRSGGQRKRNHLVVFFALFELVRQRSSFRADFLMLDEVFDALDKNGQEDVVSCIMALQQQRLSKVFLITHSAHVLDSGNSNQQQIADQALCPSTSFIVLTVELYNFSL